MTDQFNQQSTWQDHQFADPPKGHPSTWAQEVEQLQAEKRELAMQVEEACKAQDQAESAASWADIRANQAVEEAKVLRARVAALEKEILAVHLTCTLLEQNGYPEFADRVRLMLPPIARAALQQEGGE